MGDNKAWSDGVKEYWRKVKVDGLVTSIHTPFSVIPVKTGIQEIQEGLGSRRSLSPRRRGRE